MNRPTPLTDAVLNKVVYHDDITFLHLAAHARQLERSNAELRERLEMGFYFDINGQRIEDPTDSGPDGISCRDETIKLQDQRLDELRKQNAELADALENGACLAEEHLHWIAMQKAYDDVARWIDRARTALRNAGVDKEEK